MMNKKIVLLVLSIFVCFLSIVSCSSSETPDNEPPNKNPITPPTVEEAQSIYNENTDLKIVYDSEALSDSNLDKLEDALRLKVGTVEVRTSEFPEVKHELIFGRTSRKLSELAYAKLEREEKVEEDYVGYCIYSDGYSLAIAYDEDFMGYSIAEDEAVRALIEEYIEPNEDLVIDNGVVKSTRFGAIAYQQGLDDIETEAAWADIEVTLTQNYGEELAKKSVRALRSYYELYTDDLISWFANLYDPVVGGYYYSNSARNSEGFLPDLESTNQALGFIISSGMGSPKDVIPEEMQKQMVNFARSLQSPENGHFYHPQWGKELTDKYPARKGRDINNAVRILEYFGAIPLYDTPTGIKGENRIGTVLPASYNLTEKLSSSTAAMVSKVIYANDIDAGVETYLLNDVEFKKHLEKHREKMATNSYWVGNEFESVAPQIVARDKVLAERGVEYSLADIMVDWFTSFQDPETGLWEPYEGNEYDCINGILKISSAYNKVERPVPNAEKLMRYAIDAITSTADPHHVCCVLNTWYAITVLTSNISTYGGSDGEDRVKAIKAEYAEEYPAMVEATRDKFGLFVKSDGGSKGAFSYFQSKTSETSQGLVVALENTNEGDVNSSYICSSGVMGQVFSFMGIRAVDLYTASDAMRYRTILESLGEVIKQKEIEPTPIDLDDYDDVNRLMDDGILDMWIPEGELTLEEGYPYGDTSRVMRLTTVAGSSDLFQIRITKAQPSYNTVAFHTDIMFDPEIASYYTLLLFGDDSAVRAANMQFIAKPNDGVYVSVIDTDEQVKVADCKDWFEVRVEYSRLTYSKILLDIYVNGRHVATSSVPYGAESVTANYVKRIQFSADKNNSSGHVHIDNFYLEQCLKKLPGGVEEDTGPSEAETGFLNFDAKPLGAYINQGILDKWTETGSLSIVDSAPYDTESKVLELVAAGRKSNLFQLRLTKTQESFNAISFETDVMFDTTAPSVYELLFFGNQSANRGGHLLFSTDDTSVYVEGDDTSTVKIAELKKWFKLKVVYTKVSDTRVCMEVFVGDKSVAISTSPLQTTVFTAKDMTRIQFSSYSEASADGAVRFDNMGLWQILYEIPELPEEVVPEGPSEAETGLITFDAKTLNAYKSAKLLDWHTTTGSLSILDGKLYGWDSNVLELKASGKNSNLMQLMVTKTAESFNALSFETDIMFTAKMESVYELLFFGNQSAIKGAHILFSADDSGVSVYGDALDKVKIASLNEHFHLKVVYAKVDDSRVCVEIFVNNKPVAISTVPFDTTVYEAKDMTRIQFSAYHAASATGEVYFDNTGLLQISYEIPELPTTPDPEPDPTPTPTPSDSPYEKDENVSGEDWT